ncbi:Transcriptional regulator containing GAF, AAA-type ATPase, and DNA-binding Fis domains [Dyadobacter sp. SG02]|uniref:sigma 54-interacting transcriptional regulator n=1 Tax=Dyadobacter sp. SG02 TaxID=1855291 RepID=UPI0008D37035|nr:sigma 54-interacting transcriptional regulator [Dyadobacter sp. SG02]SEJ59903.1 Transcriptional regulator containing GAF, AAA-type ATPase, and DNA-binding Fis domains [Dyadobacter sp. SG02]
MQPSSSLSIHTSSCKILIVEDEYIIANNLEIILTNAGYTVQGTANSVAKALDLIGQQTPDMVLLDIYLKGNETGIDLAKQLEEINIPFIYISANDNQSVLEAVKATQPSGYIVKPFRDKDVLTTLEIGRYRHSHSVEVKLREEKALQIALTEAMSDKGSWESRLLTVARLLQKHIPFDFLTVRQKRAHATHDFNFYRVGFEEYQVLGVRDILQMTHSKIEPPVLWPDGLLSNEPVRYSEREMEDLLLQDPYIRLVAKTFRLQSALAMSFALGNGEQFHICLLNRNPQPYLVSHQALLGRLEQPLLLTLERVMAYEEVARLSEKLKQENSYLQEEVKAFVNFEEIIGKSESLLHVFNLVTQVAPTDTTVLVMGESGTGKELIARAIHNQSLRKDKILVKINCATLPANLIESELFGHEKGAFTGAIEKRTGKFELAHGGTIFLDEIGELPLELQAKLLRVLQEKEIERIGGRAPIKTDVRVIAATNRDLETEVAEGRFRMDLFYRLAAFPLTLPALRERKEDISLLAHFFARKLTRKQGKPFLGFSDTALDELINYTWPGNIRELENVIEQAVILSNGQTPLALGRPLQKRSFALNAPPSQPENNKTFAQATAGPPKNLSEMKQMQRISEREYILSILNQTNGRIRGAGGAAELLNLRPTTLEYRIEKMGIRKMLTVQSPDS